MKINIEEQKCLITLNLSIRLENAKSIQEVADSILIFNAYIEGQGYLGDPEDSQLGFKLENNIFDETPKRNIDFWNKLLELEEKLGVKFNPPYTDIDFQDICIIEEIYQNVVMITPVRTGTTINTITSEWVFQEGKEGKDIDNWINKPVCLAFEGKSNIALFGEEYSFPCIIAVYNALVLKCEKVDEQYKLFLTDESDEKKMYTVILRFKTDEDMKNYKDENESYLTLFHNAKRSYDYLN